MTLERKTVAFVLNLIDEVDQYYAIGFATRLEAFYQHYARFVVMEGDAPVDRTSWWLRVLAEDLEFSAFVAFERDEVLKDAVGALM